MSTANLAPSPRAHLVEEGGRANREAEAPQRAVQILNRNALLEDAAGLNLCKRIRHK